MTPYIVVTLAVVGMISLVPLVLYWERKDDESDKKNWTKKHRR